MTDRFLTCDGEPVLPIMGEFHFSRYPADFWEEEILKMKAGGVGIVATYLFWIHHEEIRGRCRWDGNLDLRRFVKTCERHGLLVWLRIGPWCHGECRNGGFPDWLREPCGVPSDEALAWSGTVRTNDPVYLELARGWYEQIASQVADLMYSRGGPILGVQVDNELVTSGSGRGAEHLESLIGLARRVGLDATFFSVTGWGDAEFPRGECLPMFGGYADAPWQGGVDPLPPMESMICSLKPAPGHDNGPPWVPSPETSRDLAGYPYATCEIGPGVQVTRHRRPLISPPDAASLAFTRLAEGGNMLGYYVYHGGTHPDGELTGMQESTDSFYPTDCPPKSYDFQAAVRESGRIDSRYHELRLLHHLARCFGKDLVRMPAAPSEPAPSGADDLTTLRAVLRNDGSSGFLFVNNHLRNYPLANHEAVQFDVETPDGLLRLPECPASVSSGDVFVWPVGMDLGGARLRYATAQPLMLLESDETPLYIFFAPTRNTPEFALDPATVDQGDAMLRPAPGLGSCLDVAAAEGPGARIVTLTREQALGACLFTLNGRETALISAADPVQEGSRLRLLSTDASGPVLHVAPDPGFTFQGERLAPEGAEGVFYRYRLPAATGAAPRSVSARPLGVGRWQVALPFGMLEGCKEVFVRVDYRGDVAALYMNGRRVADDFFKGEPFEFALRRWSDIGKDAETVLEIEPLAPDREICVEGGLSPEDLREPCLLAIHAEPLHEWVLDVGYLPR